MHTHRHTHRVMHSSPESLKCTGVVGEIDMNAILYNYTYIYVYKCTWYIPCLAFLVLLLSVICICVNHTHIHTVLLINTHTYNRKNNKSMIPQQPSNLPSDQHLYLCVYLCVPSLSNSSLCVHFYTVFSFSFPGQRL